MFPLIRSTGRRSNRGSRRTRHFPAGLQPRSQSHRTTLRKTQIVLTQNEGALLSSFGEQSPLFSKGFPKKNAKLISQTRATPNLIEKCSSLGDCYRFFGEIKNSDSLEALINESVDQARRAGADIND